MEVAMSNSEECVQLLGEDTMKHGSPLQARIQLPATVAVSYTEAAQGGTAAKPLFSDLLIDRPSG